MGCSVSEIDISISLGQLFLFVDVFHTKESILWQIPVTYRYLGSRISFDSGCNFSPMVLDAQLAALS